MGWKNFRMVYIISSTHYNFAKLPEVSHIDDWWYKKYPSLLEGSPKESLEPKAKVEDTSKVK